MTNVKKEAGVQKYKVPSLVRAFEILDMLAMSSIGLTKMEMAKQLGIAYSTVYNLVGTMEQLGYVRRDEERDRYYLGFKLFSFGGIQNQNSILRETAAPILEKLVRRTRITGHLAILDRGEAIYLDKKESNGFVKINSWIGKRNYIHTSAVGKALVAYLPEEEIRQLSAKGLPKRTPKTISSLKLFLKELSLIRERGYAIDDEEDETDGRCIAAPVFDDSGSVIAAIGLSGVLSQLPNESLQPIGQLLCEYAAIISKKLGYRTSLGT